MWVIIIITDFVYHITIIHYYAVIKLSAYHYTYIANNVQVFLSKQLHRINIAH